MGELEGLESVEGLEAGGTGDLIIQRVWGSGESEGSGRSEGSICSGG